MYGLDAVCSNDSPAPITNSEVSAPANPRMLTNCPNMAAPTAITSSPSAMPRFMPVWRNTTDAGNDKNR